MPRSIGVALPQFGDRGPAAVEIHAFARRAEEAGFDAVWVMEALFTTAAAYDPLLLLSFAAGVTERIGLGVATIVVPRRHPLLLAKEVATLDHLSGGRLAVTLSVGDTEEVSPFGIAPEERGDRLEEALAAMRALWTHGEVDAEGRFFSFRGATMEPKPLQQPLPIWLGGRTTRALRRAARLADGWIGAGLTPVQTYRELLDRMRELLAEAGRDQASFALGKRAYVAIERPQAAVESWFQDVYGDATLAAGRVIWGDADACTEQLLELQRLGAEVLLLSPVGADREQLELLAEGVLPHLRG